MDEKRLKRNQRKIEYRRENKERFSEYYKQYIKDRKNEESQRKQHNIINTFDQILDLICLETTLIKLKQYSKEELLLKYNFYARQFGMRTLEKIGFGMYLSNYLGPDFKKYKTYYDLSQKIVVVSKPTIESAPDDEQESYMDPNIRS